MATRPEEENEEIKSSYWVQSETYAFRDGKQVFENHVHGVFHRLLLTPTGAHLYAVTNGSDDHQELLKYPAFERNEDQHLVSVEKDSGRKILLYVEKAPVSISYDIYTADNIVITLVLKPVEKAEYHHFITLD